MNTVHVTADQWFDICAMQRQPALRLFFLPYAGGSGYPLRGWRDAFADNVELLSVRLPGRGPRLEEPPYRRMAPLTAALLRAMDGYLDVPFALFGHSMGALIAYELCAQLEHAGRQPMHLFVSGSRAPHIVRGEKRLHALPRAELIEQLKRINGMSHELLEDESMMSMYLPMLRADLAVVETYPRERRSPVSCPITALGGSNDPTASAEEIESWSLYTTRNFARHMLCGGHFFIREEEHRMLQILSDALSPASAHSASASRKSSAGS